MIFDKLLKKFHDGESLTNHEIIYLYNRCESIVDATCGCGQSFRQSFYYANNILQRLREIREARKI